MPAASALRRLVPYYRPYPRLLVGGLVLIVISSAVSAVVPWLLRAGIDDLRAGAPTSRIWTIGGGIVALALVGGEGGGQRHEQSERQGEEEIAGHANS